MAIVLSQDDYWSLIQESAVEEQVKSAADQLDITRKYPSQLGCGFVREISLRDDLVLAIANYRLHQDLIVEAPEREHPLEFEFTVIQQYPQQQHCLSSEHYFFSGSGLADRNISQEMAGWQVLDVSFHLGSDLFCAWMGDRFEQAASPIKELVKALHQDRYTYEASPTVAMQSVLQQILNCPYTGITQQIYLESKAWELIAFHLEQMLQPSHDPFQAALKPDDIARLHYAREILRQQLHDPPSLKGLARQVGSNEFTLKQGFRHIFGTTVFGWLHHCRMERAKELLEAGSLNVTEAAREVGFTNRGHFAAAFRKKFGMNPKAYSRAVKRHAG